MPEFPLFLSSYAIGFPIRMNYAQEALRGKLAIAGYGPGSQHPDSVVLEPLGTFANGGERLTERERERKRAGSGRQLVLLPSWFASRLRFPPNGARVFVSLLLQAWHLGLGLTQLGQLYDQPACSKLWCTFAEHARSGVQSSTCRMR